MNFQLIDQKSWKRKEHFDLYYKNLPCTYSMTANLDITSLLKAIHDKNLKLYPVMIYCISVIVNRHDEFMTSFDTDGNIGIFDSVSPSYTIFHKNSETFSSIWTTFDEDFSKFYASYLSDLKQYGETQKLAAKPQAPSNLFNISSIPWTSFTGFNLNLAKGYDYLLPIFTMGRYFTETDKTLLPLSVQVHHGVCDGFHVSRFINELQELVQEFS